jgi:hypothetical protein
MSADHHVYAFALGAQRQLRKVVQQVDAHAEDLDIGEFGQGSRPGLDIVVAANADNRSELRESSQHMLATDVAGMQEKIATAQRGERLTAQQPVRIGYDADEACCHHNTVSQISAALACTMLAQSPSMLHCTLPPARIGTSQCSPNGSWSGTRYSRLRNRRRPGLRGSP